MTAEGPGANRRPDGQSPLASPPPPTRTATRPIPWNMGLIHTGMADLNERFNRTRPVPKEVLDKIESLKNDLKAANTAATSGNDWNKRNAAARKSQQIADELNKLLAQVDQYELHVANALWGEKTYEFQPSYLDTIHKFYGTGGLFPADFATIPKGLASRSTPGWKTRPTSGSRICCPRAPWTNSRD